MFDFKRCSILSKKEAPNMFPESTLFTQETTFNFIQDRPRYSKDVLSGKILDFNAMPNQNRAKEEDLYEFNAGTSLTLLVDNKIIIASDTRHSSEYTINSRNMTKIFKLGNISWQQRDFMLIAMKFIINYFITLKCMRHMKR